MLVFDPQKAMHVQNLVLCNGTLHTATKPDYILYVPCARYWAHFGLTTYKKEFLSFRQLEAMTEKQPWSRKKLRMLLTDEQRCLSLQRRPHWW